MQVVIDIDDAIYKRATVYKDEPFPNDALLGTLLIIAVNNGIPLTKGHGRLIDKDAFGEKLHRYTEAPYQYALTVFNESPIILNADRSDK